MEDDTPPFPMVKSAIDIWRVAERTNNFFPRKLEPVITTMQHKRILLVVVLIASFTSKGVRRVAIMGEVRLHALD